MVGSLVIMQHRTGYYYGEYVGFLKSGMKQEVELRIFQKDFFGI
jgi:hypothetical protein